MTVAAAIVTSPEFQSRRADSSLAGLVTLLYRQALDRDPEPEGLTGWTQAVTSGQLTTAHLLLGISESPEHLARHAAATLAGLWVV